MSRAALAVLALLCLWPFAVSAQDGWTPLFNGRDLSNWEHFLAKPDTSVEVPGHPRNSDGTYREPLGHMSSDPLGVFSVVTLDGERVLRISGEVIGNLFTPERYESYHLRLQFRWGDIKWGWMKGRPRDGRILYHYNRSPGGVGYRHELQIHEGDVGSYWSRRPRVAIPARLTTDLPEAVRKARPFLLPLVPNLGREMLVYDPRSPLVQLQGRGDWQIYLAHPLNERPAGEWNTIEVIAWRNHALHVVNGAVNMVIRDARFEEEGVETPITGGSIQLQSEGAEIFFRNVEIRPLSELPEAYAPYLRADPRP